MAKKKRKSDDVPPKTSVPRKAKPAPKSSEKAPASKRAKGIPKEVDAVLRQLMGGPLSRSATTDRDRAEQVLHRAFETDDPAEVEKLARQALKLWPDCADAYSLLAEEAKGPKQTLQLYTEAVAAGERDIGPKLFKELAGTFWMATETRPYMRAMNGLANSLWVLGRREEAVECYQTMLRLNPNDNQGIRYLLASCLLELAKDDELAALLEQYTEESAYWAFSAALLAFRREGDSPHSQAMLAIARGINPHIADLLTGRAVMPDRMPPYIEPGKKSEAVDYSAGNMRAWRATHGALNWLRRRSVKTKKASRSPTKSVKAPAKPKGPTPIVKKRLARLPQASGVIWQAECRRLPIWINIDAEPVRPWMVMVVSRTEGLILAQEILEEEPTAPLLWDKLVKAMEKPAAGEPHRPEELQVRVSELWDDLEPHLDDVRIQRSVFVDLDMIDEIVEQLIAHLCGRTPAPGLLEMPGVTEQQVASFFRAAANFYRAAPWQRVASEETIKIECDQFESGPWYAAIIGQLGLTPGVALYEDLDALLRMREGATNDEQNARETVALSVTFGDQTETPMPDLDAALNHDWEIAAPEGYPSAMRKERGLVMRPPLSWELRLLEACLRLIPKFILSHDRDDASTVTSLTETGLGDLKLSLSWI